MEENNRSQQIGKLYLVANSHLDTQWRWTVRDTIRDFLPRTLRDNFARFEEFPSYILSFEGAFRYQLMREYYPEDYARLKEYVAAGRWRLAGSMLDAPDGNIPAPESLIRHILYAVRFFRAEFGTESRDLFLPDCFGFGHALPSVAAHCGRLGFSGQKFVYWMAPAETPFDLGFWRGPDGRGVPAALKPDGYGEGLAEDLGHSERWIDKVSATGRRCGVWLGMKYFGVGDRGGASSPQTLQWVEKSIHSAGPLEIVHSGSDQLFRDMTPEQREALPVHDGELLLPTHGTGCWTSQAAMKRWNRRNEQLADAAERAAVVADWLGGMRYPRTKLEAIWTRFLWHQMHDDLTGTSIPAAYEVSWNDELLSLGQSAAVLSGAVGAVGRHLDTDTQGEPVVVYNPVCRARRDAIEVLLPDLDPPVTVFDPDGRPVPTQSEPSTDGPTRVVFLASVPPLSFAVFEVRRAEGAGETDLAIDTRGLANTHLRVAVDEAGDIASVGLREGRELLAMPARLELLRDRPGRWPAWEISYSDISREPVAIVGGPAEVRVLEEGPVRASLVVSRQEGRSRFVQILRLSAGSEILEIDCRVDWREHGRLLKYAFSTALEQPVATYDLGWGTIRRGINRREKYEVPAQHWADLSDTQAGLAILTDYKQGWDRPSRETLRLSLLHSPWTFRKFRHHNRQDLGSHRFRLGLLPHEGPHDPARLTVLSARMNQPLLAFRVPRSKGTARSLSLGGTDHEGVAVQAIKKGEARDEVVLRLRETGARNTGRVGLELGRGLDEARELDGVEDEIAPASVLAGSLETTLTAHQLRTFGVRLLPPSEAVPLPTTQPLELPFDTATTSDPGGGPKGRLDPSGRALPAELFPETVDAEGIEFRLGPPTSGARNALRCNGQTLEMPSGFERLYLLAGSTNGDRTTDLGLGEDTFRIRVPDLFAWIGQWQRLRRRWPLGPWRTIPGFVRRGDVAWVATHHHDRRGRDVPYSFCYLFKVGAPLPTGAATLTLPNSPEILLFAATLARDANEAEPLQPLFE